MMHQNAYRHMQVFVWDSSTQTYDPALSCQYNPIGVELLPSGEGFSFIENGMIKIKLFTKRSAKIVDIYEPLYNIAQITWINDTSFLFQAKRGSSYGIYQSDIDGNVSKIKADNEHDYGYPTIMDNRLLYVTKDQSDTYDITLTTYPLGADNDEYSIYTSAEPLLYLTMLDNKKGYVLERAKNGFFMICFKDEGESWKFEKVCFISDDATKFFDNNNSLCEILRPFLPKKDKRRLFLPICDDSCSLDLSYYDITKHCLARHNFSSFFLPPTLKSNTSISYFGCPLITQNDVFVGLAIKN